MTLHRLEAERQTLHGHWSKDLPPVLTIDPGDAVDFVTLDAAWSVKMPEAPGRPRVQFEPWDPELDNGHALTGPVYIRGAQPGMMLGIHVEEIVTANWGWNGGGGDWLEEDGQPLGDLGEMHWNLWQLDMTRLVARNQSGVSVPMRPFPGVLGMPSAEPGVHSTRPPRVNGGNIDCRELVTGSTLYLPVAVEGGLFSTGDGHACQGDGEVSSTAIECGMERALLRFTLHEDSPIPTPWAETPAGTVTFGFDRDLQRAASDALAAMVTLLAARLDVSRNEALALASLAVDLRVTQIVNHTRGVHALLRPGTFW